MELKLILASGSPRRRELLNRAGVSFTVRVSAAEENYTAEEPSEIVRELSRKKAEAVAEEILNERAACPESEDSQAACIVLGADTVVAVGGRILGKPADDREAREMIRSIEGRAHQVYTGVHMIRIAPEASGCVRLSDCETRNFSECTLVHVVPLTAQEIRDYVACGESLDKAGAYAIQGAFGKYIDRFEGDYENVIGLPVTRVLRELRSLSEEEEDE